MTATQEIQSPVSPAVSQPNPTAIFDTLGRYQQTMALKGAIDLSLFTCIADGAATAKAIADRCGASLRGVRSLCDFLTIHGFLRKTGSQYQLTPESATFLNRNSPAYLGDIANFLVSSRTLDNFRDVASLVRKGSTLRPGCDMDDAGRWVEFARWMTPAAEIGSRACAPLLARPGTRQRVLDIAAGSGLYGISIARLNPEAEVVAIDNAPVLELAQANAARCGVQDRYRTLPGDAFELDLGSGYDLVLITNFLHMFDVETNIRFLKRIRAALNPGGRLASVGFVPNEDRISPPIPASFSLVMLANTEGGEAYTLSELEGIFLEAGLGESHAHPLPPSPMTLVITEA